MPSGIPRSIEIALAAVALGVMSPALLIAAGFIALTSGFPILFVQHRVGRDGRAFRMYKLRTMRLSTAGPQVTSRDDDRITPVGRVLRKMKIDELPAFWNVLRGDLSLVGPRPEVPRYVDLANPLWREVLRARPGLTDPVTLTLRNEEDLLASIDGNPEEFYRRHIQPFKLSGYLEYLRNRTWRGDLRVLSATARAVVRPSAAPPPTVSEMEEAVTPEGALSGAGRAILSRSL
jgi:lipopolysaccharide/colanic/teichoic acid biosynthesis glycosyltransferase